jgi:signal transduction histidine kinase
MKEEDHAFWHSVTIDIKENAIIGQSRKLWLERLIKRLARPESQPATIYRTNDSLHYDKIETGTLTLELGKVPIWDCVAATVAQFQLQAVNKKVELKLDIEKPKPRDLADVLESVNRITRVD